MSKITNLRIYNFRCFEHFEASFGRESFVVLIGRGDSGKSTILKAIDALLSPLWNYPFSDWDFHNGNIDRPIVIEGDIIELPDDFLTLDSIGFNYKLLMPDGSISSDISSESEATSVAVTIRLVVDDSLEPKWYIVSDREGVQDKELHSKDRELFRSFFVADANDSQFSFHRQSPLAALSKNTREERDQINRKMTTIVREAFKNGKRNSSFEEFDSSASRVACHSALLGVGGSSFDAQLDYKDNAFTLRNVGLHRDNIPCRLLGNGSRRLISMSIQLELTKQGGIVLVDEIEQGLETYRLLNLIKLYKGNKTGQMFLTTHSSYVVCECSYNQLFRAKPDFSGVFSYNEDFQAVLRGTPDVFFAKKILICEGKTEQGFIRKIDDLLRKTGDGFILHGIYIANSKGGDKFYTYAMKLREHHVDVCVFCDNDVKDLEKKYQQAEAVGCHTIRWQKDFCLEQQIFNDVCWNTVLRLVELAQELNPQLDIRSQVGMVGEYCDTEDNRAKIGRLAKCGNWYKDISKSEELSEIVYTDFLNDKIPSETILYQRLDALTKWIKKS